MLLSFQHRSHDPGFNGWVGLEAAADQGGIRGSWKDFPSPGPEVFWKLHWALWMQDRNPDGWKDIKGSKTFWDLPCILCQTDSDAVESFQQFRAKLFLITSLFNWEAPGKR